MNTFMFCQYTHIYTTNLLPKIANKKQSIFMWRTIRILTIK